MPRHLAVLIGTCCLFSTLAMPVATPAGESSTSALDAFHTAFVAARTLPPGSRPLPPDLEPSRLIHTPLIVLKGYLGASMQLDCGELLSCRAEKCVYFTYGPGPTAPTDDPPGSITVVTGGPWLLVVGVSKGRVVDARWLGQK